MLNKFIILGLCGLSFFIVSQTVYGQDSVRAGAVQNSRLQSITNFFVAPTEVETTATVVVPESATVQVQTSDSDENGTVLKVEEGTKTEPIKVQVQPSVISGGTVVVTGEGVSCTKITSGACMVFTCSDGTKTNTCDLMCKNNPETNTPPTTNQAGFVSTDEPKITGFYPEMGNPGTVVKVFITKGQKNFSGPDVVELGGVPLTMLSFGNVPGSVADFVYTFVVPKNAKTGKFALKKPATFKNTAYSGTEFKFIPEQEAPYITDIKPIAGYPGQEVAVEFFIGTKAFSGLDSVALGGVPVTISSYSDVPSKKPHGRIVKFKVPTNTKTGKITLHKKIFGTASSTSNFIVVPAQDAPTILSFSPASVAVGDEVVIKAVMGKKAFSGLDSIYIGKTKAEITNQFADLSGIRTFTIKVPKGAQAGKIILSKPSAFSDVASEVDLQIHGFVMSILNSVTSLFTGK